MADDTCRVDECDRARAKGRKGYCGPHYKRERRYGDPTAGSTYRSEPPADGLCTVEGCTNPYVARGYCGMHWARWDRHGDPHKVERIKGDDEARFYSYVKVNEATGCWQWQGKLHRLGYATMHADGTRHVYAHRWSYEHHVGPIPDGLEIDHLCRVRDCVNPQHLEPVTHTENMRRALPYR